MHKENTNDLDFNFGTSNSIFGDFTPDLSSLQAKPEEKVEDPIEEVEDTTEVTDTTGDDDSFAPDDDPNNTTDTDDTDDNSDDGGDNTTETDVESVSYKAIVDYLADNGIIDSIDDYDGEDTPEVIEMAVERTARNLVENYKESIPEVGKQFLDYLEKGGDPSKFISSLETPIDFNNVDLTDEDTQKKVYTEYLKSIDWTHEEIEQELADAEDNLSLERKANTAIKKLEKTHKAKQEELNAQLEREQQAQVQAYNNYISEIKETINNSNNIAGLVVSPSDKSDFEKYILERDSEGLTKYERELQENPVKTQLELAYLKFKKYDFGKVAKQAETQATKRIAGIIRNTDKTAAKSPQITKRDAGDLSAFKNL